MGLINFTLTEHLLDQKVQEAAEEAVVKTKKNIEKEMQKKTRDLKSYMDQQLRKSNIAMAGMQSDLESANFDMARRSVEMQQALTQSVGGAG